MQVWKIKAVVFYWPQLCKISWWKGVKLCGRENRKYLGIECQKRCLAPFLPCTSACASRWLPAHAPTLTVSAPQGCRCRPWCESIHFIVVSFHIMRLLSNTLVTISFVLFKYIPSKFHSNIRRFPCPALKNKSPARCTLRITDALKGRNIDASKMCPNPCIS